MENDSVVFIEEAVMEGPTSTLSLLNEAPFIPDEPKPESPFIEANTIECSLEEIEGKHIIPVYVKDNEPVISFAQFIHTSHACLREVYWDHTILSPSIRVSHPIKGRVPEARNKPASELLEHEKTLYYERMAFVIEMPTGSVDINGNNLNLIAGGVKAYNLDNLYGKKGSEEHFKVFVGFKNKVCTNLCVWSDGYVGDLRVASLGQLQAGITDLLMSYNDSFHIHQMEQLANYSLSETQFAHLIGRCRMYPHLPKKMQNEISPLLFGDNQLGAVCRDYYKDQSFCRDEDGNINLWRLYNLFTGANKSTYIDNFLDKSVSAYHFVESIKLGIEGKANNWFLN